MSDKTSPILYKRKEECCGCTACYASCPRDAIAMMPDEEGFEYPVIDYNKCIKCYNCINVCPIKKRKVGRNLDFCLRKIGFTT